jgi:hypothetical protein
MDKMPESPTESNPWGQNLRLARIALAVLLAFCFPLFSLLALSYLNSGTGYAPAHWIVRAIESLDIAAVPLLAIPLVWISARSRLVAVRDAKGWSTLFKCLIWAGALHTLLAFACTAVPRSSTSHDLGSGMSPDRRWSARLKVNTWLDATYSLFVERRIMPLRAYRAGESSGISLRATRDAIIVWSSDSRYVTAWVSGIPLCAYDTVARKPLNLRRDLLLIVPASPEERATLYNRLIAGKGDPERWPKSESPSGEDSLRLEVINLLRPPTKRVIAP